MAPLRHRLAATTCFVSLAIGASLFALPALADPVCPRPYLIGKGETLEGIASRCSTTVGDIMRVNRRIEDPYILPVGYALRIPDERSFSGRGREANWRMDRRDSGPFRRIDLDADEYTVRFGDTLGGIAGAIGVSESDLIAANPKLRDPDELYAGEVLRLPHTARQPSFRDASGKPDIYVRPRFDGDRAGFTIRAQDFPADTPVKIAAGRTAHDSVVFASGRTDSSGRLRLDVDLPDGFGRENVVLVSTADGRYRAISDPVALSNAGGTGGPEYAADWSDDSSGGSYADYLKVGEQISIEGVVTPEGGRCAAVRNAAGRLFSLTTTDRHIVPGDRVKVEARVAPRDWCDKGIALAVTSVEFDNNGDGNYSNAAYREDAGRPTYRENVTPAPRAYGPTYRDRDGDRELRPSQSSFSWNDATSTDTIVLPAVKETTPVLVTAGTDPPKEVIRGVVTREGRQCTMVRAFDGTVYGIPARLTSIGSGEGIELVGTRADRDQCPQGITFMVDQARKL